MAGGSAMGSGMGGGMPSLGGGIGDGISPMGGGAGMQPPMSALSGMMSR